MKPGKKPQSSLVTCREASGGAEQWCTVLPCTASTWELACPPKSVSSSPLLCGLDRWWRVWPPLLPSSPGGWERWWGQTKMNGRPRLLGLKCWSRDVIRWELAPKYGPARPHSHYSHNKCAHLQLKHFMFAKVNLS